MSKGLSEYYDIPIFSGNRKKELEIVWLSKKYLDYAKYESSAAHQRLSKIPPKGFDKYMAAKTDAEEEQILEDSVKYITEYKRDFIGKPTKSAASAASARHRSRSSSPRGRQKGGKSRKNKKTSGKRKKRRVRKTRRC